ncbi:MAG: hypothetical protein AAF572_17475 [Cyanobacteria bacterium P01_B01_bin.77]
MIPSVDPKTSLLDLGWRVWMETIVKPWALRLLALVFAVGVGAGIPNSSSKALAKPSGSHQRYTQPLSLAAAAMPTDDRLKDRLEGASALMTGHILTSAHVVTHRDVIPLSIKIKDNPKKDSK